MVILLLFIILYGAGSVPVGYEEERIQSGKMQQFLAQILNATSQEESKNLKLIGHVMGSVRSSPRGNRYRRWVSDDEARRSATPQSSLLKLLRSTDDSNRPRFSLHRRNSRRRRRRPDADFNVVHRRNPDSRLSANISVENKGQEGSDLIENWLRVLIEGDMNSFTESKKITSESHENLSTEKPTPRTKHWTTPLPTQTTTLSSPRNVSPAYPCDQWDSKSRTCWSTRAIGDAITFSLAFDGDLSIPHSYEVMWTKHYHVRHTNRSVTEKINAGEPPWNMAIGKNGLELRISPLTDDDFDSNKFVASVWKIFHHPIHHIKRFFKKVNFRIEITPIDLGYVYIGEHITISIERYATLPPDSMIFDWHLEGEDGLADLYSNMAVSRTRRVLHIKELRKQQEGFISCSVYTDIGIFVSKRRFFVHELNNEMLTGNRYEDSVVISAIEMRMPRDSKEDRFYEDLYEPEPRDDNAISNREKLGKTSDDISKKMLAHRNDGDVDYRQQFTDNVDISDKTRGASQSMIHNGHNNHDSNVKSYSYRTNSVNNVMNGQRNTGTHLESSNKLPQEIVPVMENYAALERSSQSNRYPRPPKNGFQYSEFKPNFIMDEKKAEKSSPLKAGGQREETVESELLLFHLNPDDESVEVDIKESFLVSRCTSDRQCSNHANCMQPKSNQPGHCECSHGFRGNGIFCWEHMDFMPPLEAPQVPKQEYPSPDEMPIERVVESAPKNFPMRQESFPAAPGIVSSLSGGPQPSLSQQQSFLNEQQNPHLPQVLDSNDNIRPQDSGDVNNEPFISPQTNEYQHQQPELPQQQNTYGYNREESQPHSSPGQSHVSNGMQEVGSPEQVMNQI